MIRLKEMFGHDKGQIKAPYISFEELDWFSETGTGIEGVHQLLLFIWCDSDLSVRWDMISDRIKSKNGKMTYSTSYYSKSVEGNLVDKLCVDAITEYNKFVDPEDQLVTWNDDIKSEIKRIIGLPRNHWEHSLFENLTKAEKWFKSEKYDAVVPSTDPRVIEVIKAIHEHRLKTSKTVSIGAGFQELYIPIKGHFYKYGNCYDKLYKKIPALFNFNTGFSDDFLSIRYIDYHMSYKVLSAVLELAFNEDMVTPELFLEGIANYDYDER